MNLNYSIIKHSINDQNFHYDFLIKNNDILECWQFQKLPCFDSDLSLTCKKIFDHRLIYLTYEGEISNNRGAVMLIENGFFDIQIQQANLIKFKSQSKILTGTFKLELVSEDTWKLKKLSE